MSTTEEQTFIRTALASVEKAEKFQRIRRIVVTCLAFASAFWWASRGPSTEVKVESVVLIGVGLIAAICTAKIMALINTNTKIVLQAIAEMQRR